MPNASSNTVSKGRGIRPFIGSREKMTFGPDLDPSTVIFNAKISTHLCPWCPPVLANTHTNPRGVFVVTVEHRE